MARPSNTEQRREQIVDGLMKVMAEKGYERASIGAIAQAAGVTQGLVHYHFSSKQEILLALGDRLASILDERFEKLSQKAGKNAHRRLSALLDAHLKFDPDSDELAVRCWVTIGAEACFQQEVGELYGRVIQKRTDKLRELIREALKAEGKSTRKLNALTASMMALIEGYYQLATASPGSIPRGTAARTVRFLLNSAIECSADK